MFKRVKKLVRLMTQEETPEQLGPPMGDVLRFWHPVLPSSRLRAEPVRVVVANVPYVLFRDREGRIGALHDACPHRLAPLSAGRVRRDGRLECAYHGWHFDVEGRGCSATQPDLAKCDATALQAVEQHGYLWLANKGVPLASLPPVDEEGFEHAGTVEMLFDAPLHVALDNFSENEHTPWLHTRFGWDTSALGGVDVEAVNHDDRTEVHYTAPQRASTMARALLLQPGDVFHNTWVTRFDPVRTAYSMYWTSGDDGKRRPLATRALIFFVPETDRTTRYHAFIQVKAEAAWVKPLLPALKPVALALGWLELDDDRKFIPVVANTPESLKGMRLGRFDKPLIHNHKLLRRIYLGENRVVAALNAV